MRLLKKEKTYNDIIYYILSENLNINNRIPTERELCERLEVSRITLRDAVDRLVGEGILQRDGRNGTRVKALPQKGKSNSNVQKQIIFVYFSSLSGGFMEQTGTAPEQLYQGIEKYVHEKNDVIMVQTGENFLKMDASLLGKIDGIIVGGDTDEIILKKVSSRDIPTIMIDYPEPPSLEIDAVFCDQLEAGYLACQKVQQKNQAKNILFLSVLYENDKRLQSGYRNQLRGVEEFIYSNPEMQLFNYTLPIAECTTEKISNSTIDKLEKFIKQNNIDGIVACSNFLEGIILAHTEKYGSTSPAPAACVVTAEALKESESAIDSVFLNLRKAGYLAASQLYKTIANPFGQTLRIAIPIGE